jgi:hypothetical protein
LVLVTSLVIPGRQSISLGFDSTGVPLPLVPANRVLLLPVIGVFFTILNVVSGLYFFRMERTKASALLVWAAGAAALLLLIIATLSILLSGS